MIKLKENKDIGLLILRVGLGFMFFYVHGLPKITGGPVMWEKVGSVMEHFGITFLLVFWGLMGSLSEAAGGLLIALGIGTRTVAAFMAFTMLIATLHHLLSGDQLSVASHAIEAGFVFLALIWLGSGKYAIMPGKNKTN